MWSLRHDPAKQPLQAARSSEVANRAFGGADEAAQTLLANATDETADLIAAQAQIFAERLGIEQTKMMEALDIYGQSIQSRLNVASVSLAREFRDTGEQLSKRIETAGEAAVVKIARQGEAVTSAIGQSVDEVERRLLDRSRDILAQVSSAGDAVIESIAGLSDAATTHVTQTLLDVAEHTIAAFDKQREQSEIHQLGLTRAAEESGQGLNSRAAAAADLLETRLQEAVSTIERMVDGAMQRFEARIEERLGALGEKLIAVDKELDQQWALRRTGLAAELVAAAGEARSAVSAAAAEIGGTAEEVAGAAKRAFAESLESSVHQWTEAADTAAQRLGSITDLAVQTLTKSEAEMSARLDGFETAVAARTGASVEHLTDQSQALNNALEALQTLLTRQGGSLIESVRASTSSLNETFAATLQETDARLGTSRAAWEDAFATHLRLLDENARGGVDSLRVLAEEHRGAVAGSLEAHHESVANGLVSALSGLHSQLGKREHEAAASLANAAHSMTDALVGELRNLAETLGTRGDFLRDQILARQSELIEVIEKGVMKTETGLSDSLGITAEALDALAARARDSLEQRGQQIATAIAHATEQHVQAVTDGANEARAAIERGVTQAVETFDSNGRRIDALIAQGVESAGTTLASGVTDNLRALEARISETTKLLIDAQDFAAQSAARFITEAKDVLEMGSREAEKLIAHGRERLVAAVAESAQIGADDLSQRAQQSQRAIKEDASNAIERMESNRVALAQAAEEAASRFVSDFTSQLVEMQRAMADGAAKLKREFADPLSDTLARIETEGAELAGTTRVLIETLVSSSSAHRDQMHQAFAREADALTATVSSNAEAFRRDFEVAITNADSVFLSRGFDVAHTLAGRIGELRALLEGEGLPLLKALDARSGELSRQIEAVSHRSLGDFERKATGLISLLTRRGDDLLSAMTAAASESARKVAQLTGEVDTGTVRAGATLREIERKVGTMLSLLDRQAAELASTDGKAMRGDQGRRPSAPTGNPSDSPPSDCEPAELSTELESRPAARRG